MIARMKGNWCAFIVGLSTKIPSGTLKVSAQRAVIAPISQIFHLKPCINLKTIAYARVSSHDQKED